MPLQVEHCEDHQKNQAIQNLYFTMPAYQLGGTLFHHHLNDHNATSFSTRCVESYNKKRIIIYTLEYLRRIKKIISKQVWQYMKLHSLMELKQFKIIPIYSLQPWHYREITQHFDWDTFMHLSKININLPCRFTTCQKFILTYILSLI